MAARSIASLTLSFGLVSIPVRLYSATESGASVRFNLLAKDGSRLKQQYVSEKDQKVVPRGEMVKGYEFEKDHFVLFTPEELKVLEEGSSPTIEIIAFIPEKEVDPIFYDKAYLLAPDKRGGKPYALLTKAMRESGRCALAKWAWKTKQYVVQVRPAEDGLVLQQLLYADEVRSLKDLSIEPVDVSAAELQLALQLIDQISEDAYDPSKYEDEEKKRILAAIDEKITGKQGVASAHNEAPSSAQVIDLMDALKASLGKAPGAAPSSAGRKPAAGKRATPAADAANAPGTVTPMLQARERKSARRAGKAEEATPAPSRARQEVTAGADRPYTLRRVQEMLGISRAVITGLVSAGFVSPDRGSRNEYRFNFQDLMLLRTAYALHQARIPPRKIVRSLSKLKASLPRELPLTGMRITAVGADVAVRDRGGNWAADSGQWLMDFEVACVEGDVTFLQPRAAGQDAPAKLAGASAADDPEAWLAHGEQLEPTDPEQAEAAYRHALALAPDYIDAYLNLGALLCDVKRCGEAVQLYEDAVPRCPASALLLFNHAIALEDQGQLHEAAKRYEQSLKLDPALADAHYNVGRIREHLGDAKAALRHFSAYRRLTG